ncbi:MAG: tetratricopeptide repeat protein [Melioribacteraceae bacterium]
MFYSISKKLFALLPFVFLTIAFSGCGVYRNFTTYFNTYYNAKTIFDQVEEDIQKKKVDVFAFRDDLQGNQQLGGQPSQYRSGQNTGYNPNLGMQSGGTQYGTTQYGSQQASQAGVSMYSGNANQDLTKVIEKCSKILQYEKESSYFPDALFMIGKALYYQQEYSKAQRKFTELAGLGETDYTNENKLWLAKTNLQLRNFDEGLNQLEEVKKNALEDDDEQLFSDAVITKISFLIFREELPKAVIECKEFIASSDDDAMKGLVAYQLGKIYQSLSDEQNALDTYASVLTYGPILEVELRSKLEHARLLKQLSKIEQSEDELSTMRDQGKFKNNLDEINIDLAQIYFETSRAEEAIDLLKDVDTTYKMLPSSGIASMKLGEVYEFAIRDYDSSYKYYTKAVSSLATKPIKDRANERAGNFDRYFKLKNEMYDLNQKLTYIKDRRLFERDSIDYALAFTEFDEENKRIEEANKASGSQLANSQESQEAARRQQEIQQKRLDQQKEIEKKRSLGINEPYPLKLLIALGKAKKPEMPKEDEKAINSIYAKNLFNQGSLFFSEMDYVDSAFIYFNRILTNYPDSTIIPQTLFSLATYYETKNDTLKADSLYKEIFDKYPKDKLFQVAGEKLGLLKKEDKKVEAKSEDPAEPLYVKAEELYYKKNYSEAIDSFKAISKSFPKSKFASKSIYYAGLIYEEQKNYDSAAVAYSVLAKDFSTDPVARYAIPKYEEYKNEKEKIRKAEEEARKAEELKKKEAEDKLKAEQKKAEELNAASQPPIVKDSSVVLDTANVLKEDKSRKKQSYLDRLKADSDTTKKVIEQPLINDDVPIRSKPKTVLPMTKKDSTAQPTKPVVVPLEKPAGSDTTKKIIEQPTISDESPIKVIPKTVLPKVKKDSTAQPTKPVVVPIEKSAEPDSTKKVIKD